METTETLVVDQLLTREKMSRLDLIHPFIFTSEAISLSVQPDVGQAYRNTWSKLGWLNLYIETSENVFQFFRSQILLNTPKQVIHWSTGHERYRLYAKFVPWLPQSRIKIWEVAGFPDLCCGASSNPLENQQQFSPEYPVNARIDGYSIARLSNGGLEYADSSDVNGAFSTVGMVVTSANFGSTSQVLLEGTVSNPAWDWTPDRPLWLGNSGQLTQTPPTSGFLQQVGVALSPNTINFELQEVIFL